jgi:hypothetical protein
MVDIAELTEWMAQRSQERQRLYDLHGKPLEADHTGEFLAISERGETILAKRSEEVIDKAISAFGAGHFALFRVGYRAVWKWLTLSA